MIAFVHHPLQTFGDFVTHLGADDGFGALGVFYFGTIGLEWLAYLVFMRGKYDHKDGLNNIAVNLINTAFDAVVGLVLPMAVYIFVYQHWRLPLLLRVGALPVTVMLVAAFIMHEIAYYVDHRIGHRVGLFWAFHQVHHSSSEFNFTVAARGFLIDGNIVLHLVAVPLAFLGVPPVFWLGMHGLKSMYGILNHADFVPKLGVLEEFIATPSNHRAHHGVQPKYIDKNYSQVTVILDRLLGTFQKEEERAIVGLTTPFHSYNPLLTQIHGFIWLGERMRSADRWQDKLAYLWRPPEWTHAVRAAPAEAQTSVLAASIGPAE
jgi:sterol desaturase/sphingolipid hydroxylase (fatty acid hydroxylase superfamily)